MLDWYRDVVLAADPRAFARLQDSNLRLTRRWAFEQRWRLGQLTTSDLVLAAARDQDQWLRRRASDWLMSVPDPDALDVLLTAHSVEARLTAVTRVPEQQLDDSTLRDLLLDRAPRVRAQARWRARRRGLDLAAVYRPLLDADTAAAVAAALEGLAAVGDDSDLPAVAALLTHPSPKVRMAAVRAVGARTDGDDSARLLRPALLDSAARVSYAAATVLSRTGAPPSTADDAWRSELASSRRAAWRLSRAAGGWTRVEADLRAASDRDPALASLGAAGIRNWLDVSAATTWGQPHADQRTEITRYLARSDLDEDRRRALAFHAGIDHVRHVTAHPAGQDGSSPMRSVRRGWRHGLRRLLSR